MVDKNNLYKLGDLVYLLDDETNCSDRILINVKFQNMRFIMMAE